MSTQAHSLILPYMLPVKLVNRTPAFIQIRKSHIYTLLYSIYTHTYTNLSLLHISFRSSMPMDISSTPLLPLFLCFVLLSGHVAAQPPPSAHRHQQKHQVSDVGWPTKMFVFGDSYVDTGNIRKSLGSSWREPYGTTFPGKPAGRFSDGRVLTDYIARFMGVKSPLASLWMKFGGKKLRRGMNFAYGGSGVFNTIGGDLLPNVSSQIGFFERLMHDSLYTKQDLQSSVVVVGLSGNDYGFYLFAGGTMQGLVSFIPQVVNQLTLSLRRIYELGARKVIVTSLQPLGCLPQMTVTTSFQQCNATQNTLVGYHNLLLQQAVAKLNNETKSSTFLILDLYNSFTAVLERRSNYQGKLKFDSLLKPCCMGVSSEFSCGSVDENGKGMYRVCSDPKSAFFWDSSHPTEAGWSAVYLHLQTSLQQFLEV